jgi:hypothetical protein
MQDSFTAGTLHAVRDNFISVYSNDIGCGRITYWMWLCSYTNKISPALLVLWRQNQRCKCNRLINTGTCRYWAFSWSPCAVPLSAFQTKLFTKMSIDIITISLCKLLTDIWTRRLREYVMDFCNTLWWSAGNNVAMPELQAPKNYFSTCRVVNPPFPPLPQYTSSCTLMYWVNASICSSG